MVGGNRFVRATKNKNTSPQHTQKLTISARCYFRTREKSSYIEKRGMKDAKTRVGGAGAGAGPRRRGGAFRTGRRGTPGGLTGDALSTESAEALKMMANCTMSMYGISCGGESKRKGNCNTYNYKNQYITITIGVGFCVSGLKKFPFMNFMWRRKGCMEQKFGFSGLKTDQRPLTRKGEGVPGRQYRAPRAGAPCGSRRCARSARRWRARGGRPPGGMVIGVAVPTQWCACLV